MAYATLPTPTFDEALVYVANHFAGRGVAVYLGDDRPAGDEPGAVDVDMGFDEDEAGSAPYVMTVWYELGASGSPRLYGEW